jgi:hypothetical protein
VSDPDDSLDRELLSYLRQIDAQLVEVCHDGDDFDPEAILVAIRKEMTGVQTTLSRLLAQTADQSAAVDLNELMAKACRALSTSAPVPVVVQLSAAPDLPRLPLPPETVGAMVHRALQLCVDHAGPGSVIHVTTCSQDGRVELGIATRGSIETVNPVPISLRSVSLADLMTGLGGRLLVQLEEDQLNLLLAFGDRASIR